ncbi:MAG: hypothetical protein KGL39_45585 [Patescibacteria group bacterium]|nr:hypothetical protein [Patescibacteria group bacterium]
MKSKYSLLLAALAAFVLAACALTPEQQLSTALVTAGQVYAEDCLLKNPALQPTLTDVANKIPDLNSGKLSPRDYGVLSGELTQLRLGIVQLSQANPADSQQYAKVDAAFAGVLENTSQLNAGAPTASQAILTSNLQDVSKGILAGIQFYLGRASVGQ